MLEPQNNSPVFAIALSLSLTCVYILHALIVHTYYLLDIFVLKLIYAWGLFAHTYILPRDHSDTSTLI